MLQVPASQDVACEELGVRGSALSLTAIFHFHAVWALTSRCRGVLDAGKWAEPRQRLSPRSPFEARNPFLAYEEQVMLNDEALCPFLQMQRPCPCPARFWSVCPARALEEALRLHEGSRVGPSVRDTLVNALVQGRLRIPSGLAYAGLVAFFSRLARKTARWRRIDEHRRGDRERPKAA